MGPCPSLPAETDSFCSHPTYKNPCQSWRLTCILPADKDSEGSLNRSMSTEKSHRPWKVERQCRTNFKYQECPTWHPAHAQQDQNGELEHFIFGTFPPN